MAGLAFVGDDELATPRPASRQVVTGPAAAASGGGEGAAPVGMTVTGPAESSATTTSPPSDTGTPGSVASTPAGTAAGGVGAGEQGGPALAAEERAGPASTTASPAQESVPTPPRPAATVTTRPPSGLTRQPSVEDEVLSLTNRDRGANGKGSVSRDGCMDGEASGWARHMAETKVMSHSADAGDSVTGCRGSSAAWADNVGNGVPCSADEMQRWWMGSSGHRANLLGARYAVVGIGVWADATGHCWFEVYFSS